MIPIRRASLIGALLLLCGLFALGIHLFTTGEEYSRFNPDWNGTSGFFDQVERVPQVYGAADLQTGTCHALLIIAPRPGAGEAEIYRSFLSGGNRLILFDEEGGANPLFASLGSSLRVVPGNLSGFESHYDSPSVLEAHPVGESPLLQNVDHLTLNRPASVSGGETLAETSLLSWMDLDGNGRPDGGEVLRRYAVIAREEVGGGEIVVVSDASLLINGMAAENPQFLSNLRSTPGLCIDQLTSRTASSELFPSFLQQVKNTYIMKIIVVAMVMFLGILVWERRHG